MSEGDYEPQDSQSNCFHQSYIWDLSGIMPVSWSFDG